MIKVSKKIKKEALSNIIKSPEDKIGGMLKAGFTFKNCPTPKQFFRDKEVRSFAKPFIERLNEKRNVALSFMTEEKMFESSARELAYIVDVFTKNVELLNGRATERVTLAPASKLKDDELDMALTKALQAKSAVIIDI